MSLISRPRCSKAPRGLFVLSWGTRIFTGTSISPSPLSRQRSTRYSFRAGRNLPDKEFRYLRTVIVTAAVHRGFDLPLAQLLLTFRHWAGVSPYTSAFAFAETYVFGKQSVEPLFCNLLAPQAKLGPLLRHPFFRRYGVILPSSLTEGRSITLGLCLPAYLCRFAVRAQRDLVRGFSWRPSAGRLPFPCGHSVLSSRFCSRDFPREPASMSTPSLSICWALLTYRVPSSLGNDHVAVQEFPTCLPSPATLCPGLRTRLTLSRLTVLRNPQAFGGSGFHRPCATHSGILTSSCSTSPFGLASLRKERSPTIRSIVASDPWLRYDA